jgi:hypothetical protein
MFCLFRTIISRDNKSISIYSFTLIIVVSLGIIPNSINNYFNTTATIHFAYGQSNQMNSTSNNNNTNTNTNTNLLNVQNTPTKKVHVGDIDIAYKIFGKGKPLLLVIVQIKLGTIG